MDTEGLTPKKVKDCDFPNHRRSTRLNTDVTTSEATAVSQDTDPEQLITPAVGCVSRHSKSSTATNRTSHDDIRITSSSTIISVLTQGTASSSISIGTDAALEASHAYLTARRSKRITSARLEYKRKQRTRLFVNPSKSTDFGNYVYQNDNLPHQSVQVDSDFIPPMSLSNKRAMTSAENHLSHLEDTSKKSIAYEIIPTLFASSQDSLTLTCTYKSVYGSDYFASLMEREANEVARLNEAYSQHSPPLFRFDARPRTRSICKEEEKEFSRIACRRAPFYMSSNFQDHITLEMRSILVGWILSVAKEFKLLHETTHCCMKVLDRGLDKIKMTPEAFHTYGCACLLIAAKLNEVKRVRAVDIAFFTDSACTTNEICSMEMQICMTLKFHLQNVTSFHFLDHFLDASFTYISRDNDRDDATVRYNPKLHAMALFIIDTSLLISSLVDVKESLIAASALYLSRAIVGVNEVIWNEQLVYHTGYGVENFSEIVTLLHNFLQNMEGNDNMKAILKKYNSAEYYHVPQKVSILSSDLKLL